MRGRIARKPYMLRFILCLLLAAVLFFFLSPMLDDKHPQCQAARLIMLAFVLAELIYLLVLGKKLEGIAALCPDLEYLLADYPAKHRQHHRS